MRPAGRQFDMPDLTQHSNKQYLVFYFTFFNVPLVEYYLNGYFLVLRKRRENVNAADSKPFFAGKNCSLGLEISPTLSAQLLRMIDS